MASLTPTAALALQYAAGSVAASRLSRPIGIDVFSGVGGMSLGFEQAGFDVVAAVEYDPVHAAVHAFNFPLTEIVCDDAARLDSDQLLEAARRGFVAHGRDLSDWTGQVDVIFGGPPCQGFSTMGKRDVSDRRNKLVYAFADLIGAIQPRYFVMENVPGMASGGQASILSRLVARLTRHGYDVVQPHRILSAADFGVPQDRRRLILLGSRNGERAPQYPMPTVRRVPKRSRQGQLIKDINQVDLIPFGPTVNDAIGDLPDLDRFSALVDSDEVRLSGRIIERSARIASHYARRLRGEVEDDQDLSYPRLWDPSVLTSSLRTEHSADSIQRFAATDEGETEQISRFYRLDRDGLSNTLRAGTGSERGAYTSPRPIHPSLPRVISVREAARLHSFPDWFRLHRTKWHGFRSIGNAVPPLLARAIARMIVQVLELSLERPKARIALGNTALLSAGRLEAAAYFGAAKKRMPSTRKRYFAAPRGTGVRRVVSSLRRATLPRVSVTATKG